jgi:hypothetical protein
VFFAGGESVDGTKKPGIAGLSGCPRKESNLQPSD